MGGSLSQSSLTDTLINNNELMKYEAWYLFILVCHHVPLKASTASLQSEAMVRVQASGLILLCWRSLYKHVHRHTHTQLWKEKRVSCWANLWRRSCTKSSRLMILWISLVNNIQALVGISTS